MEEYKEGKHSIYKELFESQDKKLDLNKVIFYEADRAFECPSTELELATTIKEKNKQESLKV